MSQTLTSKLPTAVVVLAILALTLLAACGGDGTSTDEYVSSADSDLNEFVDMATYGIQIDYRALSSPEAAVEQANSVIVGSMTRYLSEGEAVHTLGRPGARFFIVEVLVDRVLSGDSALTGSKIVLAQELSPVTPVELATAAVPTGSAVMILWEYEEDFWSGQAIELTGWPEGQVFGAFADGLWFNTSAGEFRGVHATKDELKSRWGEVGSFAALVGLLEAAGASAVAR